MNLGGYSATGPRDANEDSYYFLDLAGAGPFSGGIDSFIMVSDGMGGYQGGDVASGLAVSSAESYLSHLLEMGQGHSVELNAAEALREIVQNAHDAIVMEARERGSTSMGATFVGAFVSPGRAWIAHVGDSRAYLIRDGITTQLTEDHSQVGRMLSRGLITEEEAQSHPARNRIEKALGFPDSSPDIDEVELEQEDALLLCSDGIYTVLTADLLGAYVEEADTAEGASRSIVEAALDAGTDDNSTVVIAQRSKRQRPWQKTQVRRMAKPAYVPAEGRPSTRRGMRRPAQRKEPASNRQQFEERMPNWAAFLLIAAMVVMLLTGFLLVTIGADKESADDASATAESFADNADAHADTGVMEPTAEQGRQADAVAGDEMQSLGDVPTTVTGADTSDYSQFGVHGGAVLKYVDEDGLAQMFSYDPLAITEQLTVASGSLVSASDDEDSYGRPGKLYRSLDHGYLDDLRADCAACQSGATSYSSRLSALFEEGSYGRFVSELANRGGTFDSTGITGLILDSGPLVSSATS